MGEARLQILHIQCLGLAPLLLPWKGRTGEESCLRSRPLLAVDKTCKKTLWRLGKCCGLTEVDLDVKKA